MAQRLDLKVKGLYTDPNSFATAPQGALKVADNLVIEKQDIAETRVGQNYFLNALPSNPIKIFNFFNKLITYAGDKKLYRQDASVWTAYNGTYDQIDTKTKMQSLEANQNFYFTSTAGIKKIANINDNSGITFSGAPKGLEGVSSTTGSSGFLLNNNQVAYRIVWGYKDFNGNLILGSPSGRIIASNTSGGTRNISIDFPVPDGLTTAWFYQIYRSPQVATTIEPSDEMQQVQETFLTSGQIGGGQVITTDNTPDSLRGAFLYTSPSQEGILESNDQPPAALDLTLFRDHTFYANTYSKHRLTFDLVAIASDGSAFGYSTQTVGTTSGLATVTVTDSAPLKIGQQIFIPLDPFGVFSEGTVILSIDSPTQITVSNNATSSGSKVAEFQDRFSVGNTDYFATSSVDLGNQFLIETGLTPAENVDISARSLINRINTSGSQPVYAFYLSGPNDFPGQILIEEKLIGGNPIVVSATNGDSFTPTLPNRKLITNISVAASAVITSNGHGLSTGNQVTIYRSNSTPVVNGTYTVTVLTANTFSIPVTTTVSGSFGYFALASEYVETSRDSKPNGVFISKPSQPEAVPPLSFLPVGSENFPIKRILASRDAVFVFKDDGIFRITGETRSDFRVTLFDNTAFIIAPESAVLLNNQIFLCSTQGIVAASDSGVSIISKPIENEIIKFFNPTGYPEFENVTFGVGFESKRSYLFFTIITNGIQYCQQAFVYNFLTNAWTRWVMNRSCGVVSKAENRLFVGNFLDNYVYQERVPTPGNELDAYADEQFEVEITNITGNVVTFVNASNLNNNYAIDQGSGASYVISNDATTAIMSDVSVLGIGVAQAYKPINDALEFLPIDADNPGVLKHFREVTFFFKERSLINIQTTYTANFSYNDQGNISQDIQRLTIDGGEIFTTAPWRSLPYEIDDVNTYNYDCAVRTFIPLEQARALWIRVKVSGSIYPFTKMSFEGISVVLNAMDTRFK